MTDNKMISEEKNKLVIQVEAALARAQAKHGIIPSSAAQEITRKADVKYAPEAEIELEFNRVQHRMVALLNVWRKSMEKGAEEYVHYGTTTVDIYDTVMVLQLKQSSLDAQEALTDLEDKLIHLAERHRNTPMAGRTLGQHALPITFGKKVSGWVGTNRRNIERLQAVAEKLNKSAILKGAVGSYLGLGDSGIELEKDFSRELGLGDPYCDDWHGSRDVFAEYAMVMAMISRSLGQIGTEIFLLQSTDIGEVVETRKNTAVGSSAMPHKQNPQKSEALIHFSRKIPRLAEIILDDMVNYFERDDTSRTTRVLEDIASESAKMCKTGRQLIANLQVHSEVMQQNLKKTKGFILSQRITQALAEHIGNSTANDKMHDVMRLAHAENLSLREAVFNHSGIGRYFSASELEELFDLKTYLGLDSRQISAVIDYARKCRLNSPLGK